MEKIKGGLADNKTAEDIAKKHGVTLSEILDQLELGIEVEREHTDDKAIAKEIALDHLFENPKYYVKSDNKEDELILAKENAKDWAKIYKATGFIEKGVCTYQDETILLTQDAIDNAIETVRGRPVIIEHQNVTPENMESKAVGYVTGVEFDESTASFNCDFVIFDDKAKKIISDGYSVSCAYLPKAFKIGGTWHNTPYAREVAELEFTHLALVPDPRYEDAKIYENSKEKRKEEDMAKIEIEQSLFATMLNSLKAQFKNEVEDKKEEAKADDEMVMNEADEFEFEGKTYSKKELVACYLANQKENESEEVEVKEDKEDEEKQNSKEYFNGMKKLLENASKESDKMEIPLTRQQRIEKGQEIYGG